MSESIARFKRPENQNKNLNWKNISVKKWKCSGNINSPSGYQYVISYRNNTVVSNHFHSVKILLFSSARSRDFDGLIGIELPMSMYTTKTPIDLCRFNVRSSIWKNLNIFCKRQISIKLFYLYQRLQCRDNYFFKIKFVFFLYLRLSASWKENDLPLYISDIRQIVGYRTPVFIQPFPWHLHITITYNLPHLRLWYADVVTVIA
jgi:hypothetical protein